MARADTAIPMVDLTAQWAELQPEIEAALRETLASGQFVLGAQLRAFEREAADCLGVRHAIGCASGTDALHLALRAAGIGAGDEVITTPFSFFGTVEAIVHAGARPVFVDVREDTFNLDPSRVAAAITPRTRAILPVHLYGQPADLETLSAIAAAHNLPIIEDCAQAFGASRGGRRVGSIGAAGCFSFFPAKNLGAFGDGGMVTTDDDALAAAVRELGNHGSIERYVHRRIGFNSRLDDLQAAVLRIKLRRIDRYNAARRRLARAYHEHLHGLRGLRLPHEDTAGVHVWHQYTVLLDGRDAAAAALRARGIACAVHYPIPLHRQPALADTHAAESLPVAESLARRCLSLPMFPELGEPRVERIASALREVIVDGSEARPATVGASRREQRVDGRPS